MTASEMTPTEACAACGIRFGLGGCSACIIRMHRDAGIDGLDEWIQLAVAGLEDRLNPADCARLVAWVRGWPIALSQIQQS